MGIRTHHNEQLSAPDHRVEPLRLSEVDSIRETALPLFSSHAAQIWTGDFNALTREDYSADEWDALTQVREANCWEEPKTELTTKVSFSCFEPIVLKCVSSVFLRLWLGLSE